MYVCLRGLPALDAGPSPWTVSMQHRQGAPLIMIRLISNIMYVCMYVCMYIYIYTYRDI